MVKFGTGGWRAKIGEDFIESNIRLVGYGVALMLKQKGMADKPVIIGRDRRFLSYEATIWLAEVLAGAGITVWFMNRSVPTPLVMHTVMKQGLHCGLQVTASHNPPTYNGIKVVVDEGRDAPVEVTAGLEKIMAGVTGEVPFLPFDEANEQGMIVDLKNPFNDFIDDVLAMIDTKAIRERGPRVLFDPMHGSGIYALMTILYTARCTVDLIHMDRDAYFGGAMPAPTEETLIALKNDVISGKYDFGIALDGDGDRLGVIDATGRYMTANEILCMLYYYLHEYKGWKGPVVRNNSTTHMLDRIAHSLGEECYEVPVGFKWISSKIDEVDAVLGGESSGGLTVRGHIHGKDSAYAAALFVEMVSVMGKSPKQILDMLNGKYGVSVMRDKASLITPAEKEKLKELLFVEKRRPDFPQDIARVSYEDGCKITFTDDSFVVCRFSGTEPLIRFCAEAVTAEKAEELMDRFDAYVQVLRDELKRERK